MAYDRQIANKDRDFTMQKEMFGLQNQADVRRRQTDWDRQQGEAEANRERLREKELDYQRGVQTINLNAKIAAKEQAEAYKKANLMSALSNRNLSTKAKENMERQLRALERGTNRSVKAISDAKRFSEQSMQRGIERSTAMLEPWRNAGIDAMGKLKRGADEGAGSLKKDAGYKFRLAEGQGALDNSAAARGMALSGAALKESMRYNQGFASNEYDKHHSRYMDKMDIYNRMSNAGLNAATNMGGYEYGGNKAIADYGMQAGGLTANMMDRNTARQAEYRQLGFDQQGEYDTRAIGFDAGGVTNYADIIKASQEKADNRMTNYESWKAGN